MQSVKRFHALDSFRGIFSLSVVAFHMHIVGSFSELPLFRNADLFVEFFFVLSGFVLAHSYGATEHLNFRKFFISRTCRLLPLHIFMLVIFILLEYGKLLAYSNGIEFNNEPFSGENAAREILPNLLLIQSWSIFTTPLSFNYPSWSISVEYYVYLIFALILIYFFRGRKCIWAGIVMISSLLMYFNIDFPTSHALRGLTCFFSGTLAYAIYKMLETRFTLSSMQLTCLETSSLSATIFALAQEFMGKSLVISLLFCVVIIVFAADRGALSKVLRAPFFTLLGKLSYSIYLTHAAILFFFLSTFIVLQRISGRSFTLMISNHRNIDLGNPLLNNVLALFILATVVPVSMFTYKYIEVVGQNFGRRLNKKYSDVGRHN